MTIVEAFKIAVEQHEEMVARPSGVWPHGDRPRLHKAYRWIDAQSVWMKWVDGYWQGDDLGFYDFPISPDLILSEWEVVTIRG